MSGAYVALPAAPFVPFVPPLWNPNWDFPGPLPPGFSYNQMFLVADQEITVGSLTQGVSGGVLAIGATTPAGQMTYSATVNGSQRNLRIGNSGPLTYNVVSDYTANDNFFGSTPQLYFDITSADEGQTLMLTADGSPFGSDIYATVPIKIVKVIVWAVVLKELLIQPLGGGSTTWSLWGSIGIAGHSSDEFSRVNAYLQSDEFSGSYIYRTSNTMSPAHAVAFNPPGIVTPPISGPASTTLVTTITLHSGLSYEVQCYAFGDASHRQLVSIEIYKSAKLYKTFSVNPTGDPGFPYIQKTISVSQDGKTLKVT